MNGRTLIGVADRLGVKVACNKSRTSLKESKAKVIERILAAESTPAEEPAEAEVETEQTATGAEAIEAEPENDTEQPETLESMPMSEIVKVLEDLYGKLNELYFDGLLPNASIMVQSTPKLYGFCSTGNDSESFEISFGTKFIGRPIDETAATLLHEMVHFYCMEMGIVETCQKGRYHNGKFKAECEARDLAVERNLANGWTYTSATADLKANLARLGVDLNMKLTPIQPAKTGKAHRVSYKYTCPCCGQSFRHTGILDIKCSKCDQIMEKEAI